MMVPKRLLIVSLIAAAILLLALTWQPPRPQPVAVTATPQPQQQQAQAQGGAAVPAACPPNMLSISYKSTTVCLERITSFYTADSTVVVEFVGSARLTSIVGVQLYGECTIRTLGTWVELACPSGGRLVWS